MADIDFNQLLANAGVMISCTAILGGFFARYANTLHKEKMAEGLAAFKSETIDPVFKRYDEKLLEMANLSARLVGVEVQLKNNTKATDELSVRVDLNATQAREDLTGVANRLESQQAATTKTQTEILIAAIKSK